MYSGTNPENVSTRRLFIRRFSFCVASPLIRNCFFSIQAQCFQSPSVLFQKKLNTEATGLVTFKVDLKIKTGADLVPKVARVGSVFNRVS